MLQLTDWLIWLNTIYNIQQFPKRGYGRDFKCNPLMSQSPLYQYLSFNFRDTFSKSKQKVL